MIGGELYIIVPVGCVTGSAQEALAIVRVRLRTGSPDVIAMVQGEVAGLAAAGRRLALTYLPRKDRRRGGDGHVRIQVLDRDSGRLLYTVVSPALTPGVRPAVQGAAFRRPPPHPFYRTQLDVQGDVLVTITTGPLGGIDWWGNANMHLARPLPRAAGGILSDGRVAYVTGQEGLEHIDVLNLKTGQVRTEVEFRGAVRVEGLGFSGARLAWAQGTYGFSLRNFGRYPCVEFGELGSTELSETTRSAAGPPPVVEAVSPPRPPGIPCTRNTFPRRRS